MAERTVVVLGAGASVSEARHFRPSRDRDHPPLDATFFRRAARHTSGRLLDRVVEQGKAVGQPDLFRDDPPVSLEEHLGRLYFEMQNTGTTAAREAYFSLVQLYQSELLKTTNWMIGRSGRLRGLLNEELQRRRRVSIVTFNHDLLAENALSLLSASRRAGAWCLTHAYDVGDLDRISAPGAEFAADCPGHTEAHVRVLKLHGSVNWVFRTRDPFPPQNIGHASSRKLFLWTNMTLPTGVGVKLHTPGHGRDWYLWPLIVPPIYEKHGLIRGELEQVWRRARREVEQTDRIIFWGYSFPRADLHARYFFESIANSNEALRHPILINPDPASESELWKVLRPRSVQHYRHVGEYLDHEYQ